jgi:hypothetical protein
MKKVKGQKKTSQPKSLTKRQQKNGKTESKEQRDDADLPGYPHYSASEAILNQATRVPAEDLDELTVASPRAMQDKKEVPEEMKLNDTSANDTIKIVPGTEADVTKEDLRLLGPRELNNDLGDDELLKGRSHPVDMAGKDLDVPGSELDDADEALGEEDEENNNWSIGGDRHEDLEENPS